MISAIDVYIKKHGVVISPFGISSPGMVLKASHLFEGIVSWGFMFSALE